MEFERKGHTKTEALLGSKADADAIHAAVMSEYLLRRKEAYVQKIRLFAVEDGDDDLYQQACIVCACVRACVRACVCVCIDIRMYVIYIHMYTYILIKKLLPFNFFSLIAILWHSHKKKNRLYCAGARQKLARS